MDSELVVLHFASFEAAERALGTVKSLEAEGFLRLDESAILGRDHEGVVKLESTDADEPVRASALGGVVGLVAGGVIGLPVLGVLAGAGLAAKHASHADQLGDLITTVGENMDNGTGVLVLHVASLDDPEIVADRLGVHRDQLIRAEVPAALRAKIDEHDRTGGSSGP